ncbi:MAG: transcriptional regulator, partial [Rhodobacteraceae bacterium]|nr:transcriptional regulator [Paracoccaceae bacterium]
MQYLFNGFTLDLSRGELVHDGDAIAVEPRAFALVVYLVENADRLISKDELVEKLWEGRIVTDAAISTLIKSARKVLGDSGQTQKYIRTVHGRGFRFVGSAALGTAPAPAPAPA